ncbi:MAG: pitrilysin family protein [Armatimonadota bacterium]|nr:pitrilysin family protein [Armatimonadota bacterium]
MTIQTASLDNGLPVLFSPAPGTPRTAVCITLRGGARTETHPGTAGLAARLLLKGTTTRTAEAIAEEIDRRALQVHESSGPEHLMLRVTSLNGQLEAALQLAGDLLRHSTFAHLPKEAARLAGEIQSALDQPRERARDLFIRAMFPAHPYGHTGSVVLRTLSALQVEQVRDWYYPQVGASRMGIVVVGDVDPDALLSVVARSFADVPAAGAEHAAPVPQRVKPPLTVTEAKSEANQAQIYQGWYTPGHAHPDRAPLAVLNTLLGAGGLSSRLFVELRDKRGLAYAVRSGFSTFSEVGLFSFYIGTSPDNIRRAIEGFAEQVARVQEEAIPEEEVEHAKGHLRGEFVLGHETNTQRCTDFAVHHALGLGYDFSTRFLEEIAAVTPADVQRVARTYLSPPPVTAVVATGEALAAAGL